MTLIEITAIRSKLSGLSPTADAPPISVDKLLKGSGR